MAKKDNPLYISKFREFLGMLFDWLEARKQNTLKGDGITIKADDDEPQKANISVDLRNISNQRVGALKFITCTQAEYDAMEEHDSKTLYIVKK